MLPGIFDKQASKFSFAVLFRNVIFECNLCLTKKGGDLSDKLPISAVVVSFNEASRLSACLESLWFCQEIIVCDLGSQDGSPNIGRKFATKYLERKRVDYVELLWPELFEMSRFHWVLRFDPDQVLPAQLVPAIKKTLYEADGVGSISIPMLYYFLRKPLRCSVWGGVRYFPLLFDKRKLQFSRAVHRGLEFTEDARHIVIRDCDEFPIKHYWVDGIIQMWLKHFRYIRNEGVGRIEKGERFSFRFLCLDIKSSLNGNFIVGRCHRSGLVGWYLAIFHLAYIVSAHLSLLRAQVANKLSVRK